MRENKKNEKMLEEKKIYQWEEYSKMPRKLLKTCWGRSKYTRLKNLIMYFRLIKALLKKKNSISGRKSKISC